MIVAGTDISIPDVRLFCLESIIITWVIPALYPVNSCIFGSFVSIRHEFIRAIGFFDLFFGVNASDPLRGLCIVAISQSSFQIQ